MGFHTVDSSLVKSQIVLASQLPYRLLCQSRQDAAVEPEPGLNTMVRRTKDVVPTPEEHPGGGHITVTAQQSRYALDAVDAPASKEASYGTQSPIPLTKFAVKLGLTH
ncbi:hypothetical protein J1614_003600 [Plenodomus biglobosus]|nr:hypothetical protein J1614_003600 [Plenodomus biglobosus]